LFLALFEDSDHEYTPAVPIPPALAAQEIVPGPNDFDDFDFDVVDDVADVTDDANDDRKDDITDGVAADVIVHGENVVVENVANDDDAADEVVQTVQLQKPTLLWNTNDFASSNDDGYTFYAFNTAYPGVLSIKDLNAEIESVFDDYSKQYSTFTKQNAGIVDVSWHQDCISRALTRKYGRESFSWTREKQRMIFDSKKGNFYVTGILNPTVFPDVSNNRRQHALCVNTDQQKFYDRYSKGRQIASWFKTIDPYLSPIWKVWKLEFVQKSPLSILTLYGSIDSKISSANVTKESKSCSEHDCTTCITTKLNEKWCLGHFFGQIILRLSEGKKDDWHKKLVLSACSEIASKMTMFHMFTRHGAFFQDFQAYFKEALFGCNALIWTPKLHQKDKRIHLYLFEEVQVNLLTAIYAFLRDAKDIQKTLQTTRLKQIREYNVEASNEVFSALFGMMQ
jgi:hypothetical protein